MFNWYFFLKTWSSITNATIHKYFINTNLFIGLKKGQFERENYNAGPSTPSSPGETNCAAISASATIEPHGKCTIAFALAWSSPKVKFSKGKSYSR